MSKIIVFLADGTWNGTNVTANEDGQTTATNVLKFYHNLAGDDTLDSWQHAGEGERVAMDASRNVTQIAKYLHGVGDSSNIIERLLGGAFGAGIVSRIVRGYTFICRNYQPGDKIIIAGFSRGAYTARALGGMITKAGLMDYAKLNIQSKEDAYRYGFYVWSYYRQRRATSLANRLINQLWSTVESCGYMVGEEHMITNVPIEAIGVWDTVGSLGIPVYGNNNQRLDLFRFADTALNPLVKNGFHALAVDEFRADFNYTAWDARAGIEQRWFCGGHGDVGGGYEQAQLIDIASAWMMDRLVLGGNGIMTKTPLPVLLQPDYRGAMHDESQNPPFSLGLKIKRAILANHTIDASVLQRRNDATMHYRPTNLP